MSDIDWSQFGGSEQGQFIKFANVGDSVSGEVVDVRAGTDFNGNVCPVLDIDTEDGLKTVTGSQAMLKALIVRTRPKKGDNITIVYVKDEKAALGTKKVFDVIVDGSAKAPF
jgi:hypothetical protein